MRSATRQIAVIAFDFLMVFWLVKAGYVIHGYITGGAVGVRLAVLQHVINPYNPGEWGPPTRWDIVAMRYGMIALLTIGLGFVSRHKLRKTWLELWHRHST
jgi:hypothetical protein